MSMTFGKAEVAAMVETLDADYESVEDAAKAALEAAEAIFEKRANFVVVGQLSGSTDRPRIPASDPEAIKLSLGWYSTEAVARSAAESLVSSRATGDRFRAWVLPVHHGTPAELHAKRKEQYERAEAKRDEAARERLRKSIEQVAAAAEERASGGRGSCENCGCEPWEHSLSGKGRSRCLRTGCDCEAWKERIK